MIVEALNDKKSGKNEEMRKVAKVVKREIGMRRMVVGMARGVVI